MNIKKIIAREGLIILGLIVVWIIGVVAVNIIFPKYPDGYHQMRMLELVLVVSYPFYWLIRFIIWAIKTLRKK